MQVFSEFRAMKKDRQDAKEASQGLAVGQLETCQAKLQEYFELSAMQRNKLAVEDRQESAQVAQDVLVQAEFNFPKMHLLSHYSSQIKDFGNLPPYSTEITEALHKPLKEAYGRSNRGTASQADLGYDHKELCIAYERIKHPAMQSRFPIEEEHSGSCWERCGHQQKKFCIAKRHLALQSNCHVVCFPYIANIVLALRAFPIPSHRESALQCILSANLLCNAQYP